MDREAPKRKQLVRDAKRAALLRMEDAARTEEDYKRVVEQWDHNEDNQLRRVTRWEIGRTSEEMLHWDKRSEDDDQGKMKDGLETVIPPPLGHVWWRQLLRGDFLDVMHDCPYDLHELTASSPVSDILKTLNENQIEVFYYWVIRQYTPQRIARLRNQTDRNILKVYATLIEGLRRKLYRRLLPRFEAGLPLTMGQQQFMEDYADKLRSGQHGKEKGKK